MDAKAGEYRRSELPGLDVTISARYHWSVARQLTPFHYVFGISEILPYNRNVTLQTLELFTAYTQLYNAAASPEARLRSAGSLAITQKFSHESRDNLFTCISWGSKHWGQLAPICKFSDLVASKTISVKSIKSKPIPLIEC